MRWYHEVNPEWLRARKKYLSASDIQGLLPVTPTGAPRPSSQVNKKRLEIWGEKNSEVTQDEVVSTGAAARGHHLEKYAIELFNMASRSLASRSSLELFHWDDALIYNTDDYTGLSFSPDALSIPQPDGGEVEYEHGLLSQHATLAEVKSYKASAHYLAARTNKMQLVERWQIATSLAVAKRISHAYLILFNPLCKHKMFVHRYDRKELEKEIRTIKNIDMEYWSEAEIFDKAFVASLVPHVSITEAEIEAELQGEFEILNPQY